MFDWVRNALLIQLKTSPLFNKWYDNNNNLPQFLSNQNFLRYISAEQKL